MHAAYTAVAPRTPPIPTAMGNIARRQRCSASGQHCLEDFLRQERQRERYADIVDGERQHLGCPEIAVGRRVRPRNRENDGGRHDEEVFEDRVPRRCHRLSSW
jgi:hypothetical protein